MLSAGLLVTLNTHFQMSGEWLIGGVEAKGFAYVLVVLGLEAIVRGWWSRALLLLGASAALHVVVGGWSLVAAAVVWLTSADRPPLRSLLAPLAGALLLSLPGLLPALALTWHADPRVVAEANQIYVFERLVHHLVPRQFPPQAVIRHLLLVGVLVVLVRFAPDDPRWQRLRGFVAAAVGLAAIGMLVGLMTPWNERLSAALLRYYWFRLSDVMVPAGVALVGCWLLASWRTRRPRWHDVALAATMLAVGWHLGDLVVVRYEYSRPPADAPLADLAAWRDVCRWAATETPSDSVFLTPRLAQTFRWYAGRAEVVTRKDVPQDADGIVEWWRRMNRIQRAPPEYGAPWYGSLAELGAARFAPWATNSAPITS